MDEQTKNDQAAIDAVQAATTGTTDDPNTATNTTPPKKRAGFRAVIERLKALPFAKWGAKCRLTDANKARLKAFAGSNVGIVVIALAVVVVIIVGSVMLRHHKHHETASNDAAWSNTTRSVAPQPTVAHAKSRRLVTTHLSSPAVTPAVTSQTAVGSQAVMEKLNAMSQQLNNLEQRLMVVTNLLAHKNKAQHVVRHYRVLGTRLDQDTNQYVADIEYAGHVKAYYAGQRMGRWVVRSVNASGATVR